MGNHKELKVSVAPLKQGLKMMQLQGTIVRPAFTLDEDRETVNFVGKSKAANIGTVAGFITTEGIVVMVKDR